MSHPGPLTELIGTAARAGVRGPWVFDHAAVLLARRAAALGPLLGPGAHPPALPDGVCLVAAALLDSLEGFVDLRAPREAKLALCATAELFATAVAGWVGEAERRIARAGAPSNAWALRASWNALEVQIVLDVRRCMDS